MWYQRYCDFVSVAWNCGLRFHACQWVHQAILHSWGDISVLLVLWKWILQLIISLNLFTSFSSFLGASLGFSIYSIISYTKSESFTSFQFGFFFLSNCCGLTNPMLNKSGKSGQSCPVPDLSGTFCSGKFVRKICQTFTFEYDTSCETVINGLDQGEVHSLCTYFVESFFFFHHTWMLNFVNSFFCTCSDDHIILSFNLLMWYITLIEAWILNHSCTSKINYIWSWYMIHLTYC